MADKKKLSVAEILAAARKADGGGGAAPSEAESEQAAAKPAETKSATDQPATKPRKPGERPSVAEMMAMARAEKSSDAPPTAAKAEAKKPAAKPAPAAATKSKSGPAAKTDGDKLDTASILAAARKDVRRGPVSKADAANREKPDAPAAKPKREVPPMPEKPAYVRPKPKPAASAKEDRRMFLGVMLGSFMAVGMTAVAATLGLWTLGLLRFMFPNILIEPPSQFKIGFPGDFAPGTVTTKFKARFGIWVINTVYDGERQIYALRTVCTHLGCTPNWLDGDQKFKCPCHGSGFYITGINFEGPAPRPLERYAIRIADDGQVEVDKSKLFQEELGQWKEPASFVTV